VVRRRTIIRDHILDRICSFLIVDPKHDMVCHASGFEDLEYIARRISEFEYDTTGCTKVVDFKSCNIKYETASRDLRYFKTLLH